MAKSLAVAATHHAALLELLDQFGAFGASGAGINRLAASHADQQARDHLCNWFERHGFVTLIDAVGNVFGVLKLGRGDEGRSFFCGSHLDSQPNGGRFDGTLGVVCACIAGLVIRDHVLQGRVEPEFGTFVVANWTGEEGARFQPSLLGSRVFAGSMPVEDALNIKDGQSESLCAALTEIGYHGSATPPDPDHYLELHIEQGAKLEEAGVPIGIVSSCWGARKLRVIIAGQPDHTGPTPMPERRDALLAAAELIVRTHEISKLSASTLHSSVARIEVSPNSPNTVADNVELWIEFRSADTQALDEAVSQIQQCLDETAVATKCGISIRERETRDVVIFDEAASFVVAEALDRSGIPHLGLETIAGHDAVQLQSICPSTLLFVPSHEGVSHSPDEYTSEADIRAGFDAMMQSVGALISRPVAKVQPGATHV